MRAGVTPERWNACYRKIAWFDPIEAALFRAHLSDGHNTRLYLCGFCGSLHIGHDPTRRDQNRSARAEAGAEAAMQLLDVALGRRQKDPEYRWGLKPNRWVLNAIFNRLREADAEREPADA